MWTTLGSIRHRSRRAGLPPVVGACALLMALLLAHNASAQEATTLFHRPPGRWSAGMPQRLEASVERDWEITRVLVRVRGPQQREFETLEMGRAMESAVVFAAIVPGPLIQPPGLEYFIATEDADGNVQARFGTEESPHSVPISGTTPETELADRLARHHGHRSSLRLSGELTRYGARLASPWEQGTPGLTEPGSDNFWTVRADYTYRLLGVLYDIHFGLRGLRGEYASILPAGGGDRVYVGAPTDHAAPGLYSGHAGVTLEASRIVSFEVDLILGATDSGFAGGFSGLFRIGRIAATRLELSGEFTSDTGGIGTLRFAWDTVRRVPMAVAVELNDLPARDANPVGTRLLYDIGAELGDALTLTARVGYAARGDSIEGGWVVGLGTTYEF